MSFSLSPVFSFRLNQTIVGQIKFGKFDGIHVCLTAATSTEKVIIHSPHKKIGATNNRIAWSDTNYDVALLNFNQEITAIETGCVSDAGGDGKEILVIGSPTHLLGWWNRKEICHLFGIIKFISAYIAYNVDDNTDLFYNAIREGVSQIIIGHLGNYGSPLVVVGGNGKCV